MRKSERFARRAHGHKARAAERAALRAALRAGVALVLMAPGVAMAQSAEEAPPAPPPAAATDATEIVVTATKREVSLQAVPVAVTVTTAEVLKRAEIRDVSDLSSVVPSLKVDQHENSTQTNFLVRGFGNGANNVGIEPSVGVFIDGVYRSRISAQLADFPDVSRIEVLKGPQSTLFGKNASAGVISITTAEPKFKAGGSAEATYGNYNAAVFKFVTTGPVSDTLAYSLAGGLNIRDGYNTDLGTGGKTNNRNRWFVRGQLLFTPSDALKIRLIADVDRIDERCCAVINLKSSDRTQIIKALGGAVNDPANPFSDTVYSNFDATNKLTNYGFSGQIDYQMGPFKLTSITAWRHSQVATNEDADFTSADLVGTYARQLKMHDFTQELRFTSDLPGPLNFLAGAYYFDEQLSEGDQLVYGSQFRDYANALINAATGKDINFVEGALSFLSGHDYTGQFFKQGQGQFQAYGMNDKAFSLFGQVDFKPVDRLTLTGGLNWTHDAKHYSVNITSTDVFSQIDVPGVVNQALGAFGQGIASTAVPLLGLMPLQIMPAATGVPNALESGRTDDSNLSWTARASYELARRVQAYVNVSTGFKASSINLSRDSRPAAGLGNNGPASATIGTTAPLTIGGVTYPAGFTVYYPNYGSRSALPEKSTLFEAGFKGAWRHGLLNVAVFKEIIRGFQQDVFTGTSFFLANAGKESTWGLEAEGSWKPAQVPGLTLAGGVTWLNPKYDSFNLSSVGDLTGMTPAGIPKWSFNVSAQQEKRLAHDDALVLRVGWHFESRVPMVEGLPGYLDPDPITQAISDAGRAQAIAEAQKYTRQVSQIDMSLTYVHRSGTELTVWARNLNDHRNLITVFDSPAQTHSLSSYTNEPRTYGATLRCHW